jgi:Ca-activated chloride channel family protein
MAGEVGTRKASDDSLATDQWREEGPWLALLLLPLGALAFRRGWVVVLAIAVLPFSQPAEASLWDDLWLNKDQQAQRELEAGNAADAAGLFENPEWRAVAEYEAGAYAQSAARFAEQDDTRNLYNLGNALARQGEFESAIDAYEQVLEADPDNEDAAYNRDILKQMMENQESQQQNQGDDQQSSDQSGGDSQESESDASSQNESSEGSSDSQSESGEQNASQRDDEMSEEDMQALQEELQRAAEEAEKGYEESRTIRAGSCAASSATSTREWGATRTATTSGRTTRCNRGDVAQHLCAAGVPRICCHDDVVQHCAGCRDGTPGSQRHRPQRVVHAGGRGRQRNRPAARHLGLARGFLRRAKQPAQ